MNLGSASLEIEGLLKKPWRVPLGGLIQFVRYLTHMFARSCSHAPTFSFFLPPLQVPLELPAC